MKVQNVQKLLVALLVSGAVGGALAQSVPVLDATVVLAQANAAAPAAPAADGKPVPQRDRHEQHIERLAKALDLTPEQRTKMGSLMAQEHAAGQKDRDAREDLRSQREKLLAAPTIDRAAIDAIHQKEVALHADAAKRRNDHQLAQAEILTPEQRQKAAEMRSAHREKGRHGPKGPHGERHGHHGPEGKKGPGHHGPEGKGPDGKGPGHHGPDGKGPDERRAQPGA